jgi:hypothetical protein
MRIKIMAIILGAAAFFTSAVYAAENKTFYIQDGAVVFDSDSRAVVSCYDDGGKLVYSGMYTPSDGKITADIPEDYVGMQKRVYIEDSNEVLALEEAQEETPMPSKTPESSESPVPTSSPSASPAPERTPYPSIYPSESDAVRAFMVCEKVSYTQNADNEPAFLVEAFYQGEKVEVMVDSDAVITSAPQRYLYLSGQDASALKKGDVFRLTYNLAKTHVTRIDFIFRPDIKTLAYDSENYGDNFEDLFSYNGGVGGMTNWTVAKYGQKNTAKYQYAFGIIVDKTPNYIALMNKEGKTEDMMEIDVEDGTIVYTCDVSEKYDIKSTSISGVTKTYIPSSLLEEEKIEWDSSYNYSYALVRIIDDVATDIVVFKDF